MKLRFATGLALLTVLLQTAQPLLAAVAPARAKTQMTAMAQPCDGAAAAYTAAHAATSHATQPTPMPMPTGSHNMGCCCHGPWSCGGPCGMLALGPRPVMPALPTLSHRWTTPVRPRLAAAHPLELLRPPTDS